MEYLFVQVFMNMPLELCEARDAKGLYKLARDGKIKGTLGESIFLLLKALADGKENEQSHYTVLQVLQGSTTPTNRL